MHVSRPLIVSTIALLLLGAGCNSASEPATNTPPINRPTTNAPAANRPAVNTPVAVANTNTNTPTPASGVRALPAATGIDSTWTTYRNTALGFSFQTPTKGRYAPTWEVGFLKLDDAHIVDGCYVPDANPDGAPERVVTSAPVTDFCVSASGDAGAGNFYVIRDAVTRINNTYVRINFVNHVYNAGAVGCTPMPESGMSTSATSCVPFVEAEYQAQIDTILATFNGS